MFNDDFVHTNNRPRGALELALQARDKEKAQALVVADYQAENAARTKAKKNRNKGLLAILSGIFR